MLDRYYTEATCVLSLFWFFKHESVLFRAPFTQPWAYMQVLWMIRLFVTTVAGKIVFEITYIVCWAGHCQTAAQFNLLIWYDTFQFVFVCYRSSRLFQSLIILYCYYCNHARSEVCDFKLIGVWMLSLARPTTIAAMCWSVINVSSAFFSLVIVCAHSCCRQCWWLQWQTTANFCSKDQRSKWH